jgi:hypothetical protein
MLIRIAESERLLRHVGALPPDAVSMNKLIALSDDRFQEMLENGAISPGMKRKDAAGLSNELAR